MLNGFATAHTARPYEVTRQDTHWGYVVCRRSFFTGYIAAAEIASIILGYALLAGVIGVWILPDAAFTASPLMMKALLSLAFVFYGTFFMSLGAHGVSEAVEIDHHRRELRHVDINRKGEKRIKEITEFKDVSDVVVYPVLFESDRATLTLCIDRLGTVIPVLRGSKEALEGVAEDLRDSLRYGRNISG